VPAHHAESPGRVDGEYKEPDPDLEKAGGQAAPNKKQKDVDWTEPTCRLLHTRGPERRIPIHRRHAVHGYRTLRIEKSLVAVG
jgi:hypothetical protein